MFYTTDAPRSTLHDLNVVVISLKSAPNRLVYSTPFSLAKNIYAEMKSLVREVRLKNFQ